MPDFDPAVILYDDSGVAHAVRDGVAIPANTPSVLIAGAHKTDGKAYHARMIDDTSTAALKRVMVEADLAPGAKVTVVPAAAGADIGSLFRQFLTDDGTTSGSSDMVVDGSVTEVPFWLPADATKNIVLTEIRLVMTAFQFDWGGAHFGKGGGPLPNGVEIMLTANSGQMTEIGVLTINEDVLMLPARNSVVLDQGGNRDVLALSIDLGGLAVLETGTGDEVRVKIRDDLTTGARDINYFRFAAFGVKRDP